MDGHQFDTKLMRIVSTLLQSFRAQVLVTKLIQRRFEVDTKLIPSLYKVDTT